MALLEEMCHCGDKQALRSLYAQTTSRVTVQFLLPEDQEWVMGTNIRFRELCNQVEAKGQFYYMFKIKFQDRHTVTSAAV